MKVCTQCHQEKLEDHFAKSKGGKTMRHYKNAVCLICKYVIPKDNKPYCTHRQIFTEEMPEIKSLSECPQRHTFVDDLPDIHTAKDIGRLLRG